MATLYVSEFPAFEKAEFPFGLQPSLADQTVAIGGSSAASAAFSVNTGVVQLHTDAICSIKFAGTPVATATNMRMAANETRHFTVQPGQKVAVITNT